MVIMKNNNVLLIAPNFYGYDEEIKKVLEERYKIVYLKNEQPFKSPTRYFLLEKISKSVKKLMWKKYENSVKELIVTKDISIVFLIRGQFWPESLLKWISERQDIRLIYYQWDSVHDNPNSLVISKYADKCLTFDAKDVDNYPQFEYLPLFYNWSGLKRIKNQRIGMLFFGSWTFERLEIAEQLIRICERLEMNCYVKLFIPLQSYIKRVLQGKSFPLRFLIFRPVNKQDYYNLLLNSDVVFDAPLSTQTGSSMRSIEATSLKKKLITTNKNIVREKFYRPENMLIWPTCDDSIRNFLEVPYNDDALNDIVSLEQWLDRVGL